MANARMEVDAAKQKLQNFYNERAQAQSTAPQGNDSLSDGTGDHLESGERQENTQGGNAADAYTKEQEIALQEEIRAKEEALNQAIIARNNEVREAERAVQDADMAEATDGSLENAEAELSALQKESGKLQALLEAKGEVKAPVDGVIKSMSASTGSQTTEEASVILYETGGSLRMTGTIYKDDLKYVEIGGKASVKGKQRNGNSGSPDRVYIRGRGRQRQPPDFHSSSGKHPVCWRDGRIFHYERGRTLYYMRSAVCSSGREWKKLCVCDRYGKHHSGRTACSKKGGGNGTG